MEEAGIIYNILVANLATAREDKEIYKVI